MGNWTSSTKSPDEDTIAIIEDVPTRQLGEEKLAELEDFKVELARKREVRREILAAKKEEFESMRLEIESLKEENRRLKDAAKNSEEKAVNLIEGATGEVKLTESLREEIKSNMLEIDKARSLIDKNRELQVSIAEMQQELQNLNCAMADFEKEREEYKAHIGALKEVINISKKMLLIRESQLKELKEKVEAIEQSVSEKEISILSKDLRMEYEKQLQIMRNMRSVYEERQRSDYQEKQELKKVIDDTKRDLEAEQKKNKEADERIAELDEINSRKYDEIKTLESNFGLAKAESRQYQGELAVINQLFSEILLGFNTSHEIDLDKLIRHLEDNHALLQNIASGEMSSESAFALPKVLLDLVHQVHKQPNQIQETQSDSRLETIMEETDSQYYSNKINSVEEIVELLPKVWRVLIELLSHQKVPVNDLNQDTDNDDPCYKTVQTPKGPSLVLSVSQTFIRLKDLILEKKSLEKETCHLKQLNTHLESRLSDQERRLEMVSTELNKTWHVVGKLQKQHQQLHTQEKILRYELAQKRKLLTTLKEELEDSRGKWQEAREKNSKTEKQWKQLRIEFASRRSTLLSDEFSNSQESGYSDEKCSSSEDEPGYETDVSEIGSKINASEDVDEEVEDKNEQIVKEQVTAAVEKAGNSETFDVSDKILNHEVELASLQTHDINNTLIFNEAVVVEPQTLVDSDKRLKCEEAVSEELVSPSTSQETSPQAEERPTTEFVLSAREERLKKLEGECGQLMAKVLNTGKKSVELSNKLDDIHSVYGGESTSQSTSEHVASSDPKEEDSTVKNSNVNG